MSTPTRSTRSASSGSCRRGCRTTCILTADSGSAANWYARDLKIRKGMMASLSGTLATMGPGVPYAIAAKFALPGPARDRARRRRRDADERHERADHDREVLARSGATRGSIVLVLNNHDLNQVTWEQRVDGGRPEVRRLAGLPDFPTRGTRELLGLEGIRVDKPDDVGAGLGRGARGRPAGASSRRSPIRRCRRCRRTSRSSRRSTSRERCCAAIRTRGGDASGVVASKKLAGIHAGKLRATARLVRIDAAVETVAVAAYTVPTDEPEADGTLEWDTTTLVVVEARGRRRDRLGYTYATARRRPC